jgi:hypothetical protein
MSSYSPSGRQPTFQDVLHTFAQDPGLPFADVLTEQEIEQIAQEEGVSFATHSSCIYTVPVLVWAWTVQCLSASKSCVATVARVMVLRIALGLPPCSAATGGYCTARNKLSERFLRRLALTVGTRVERQTPAWWRCHGRRVLLVDGAEVSMPDTPENQAAYPQNGAVEPGLGFPKMRIAVLLAFASACVVGAAFGPCKGKTTGETALLRSMFELLLAKDILVADRYYCSFWLVAMLMLRHVDVVFRLHQTRQVDYTKAQRLGAGDHLIQWSKAPRPEWMDEKTYEQLSDILTLRLVCVHVDRPGWRCKVIDVVTTLTDPKQYSKKDIAEMYHRRWYVELDIRCIKQTLHMHVLTCQTPEMVRKEVWTHLLAYNLVRKVMAQAAQQQGKEPRRLSFAGAVQTMNAFRWLLLLREGEVFRSISQALAVAVTTHEVGNRPGRYEPRMVKRVPRKYPPLNKPRRQARQDLLNETAA